MSNDVYTISDFPERVEIEMSHECNLSCPACPRQYLDTVGGYMSFDLYAKLIDEIACHPDTIVVLHRRGESLLHPRCVDMFHYIKGKVKEVQLATNATVMDAVITDAMIKCLDFVSFSLDLPERYERNKGVLYDTVLRNVTGFLRKNNGRVRTQVSMVKTADVSDDDCAAFHADWAGKVDSVRIYEEHSLHGVFGSTREKRMPRQTCAMPFYQMTIFHDGSVARCNHDWQGGFLPCTVAVDAIAAVWQSPAYAAFRQEHCGMTFSDAVCSGCDSWYPVKGAQQTGILFGCHDEKE